MSFGSSLDYNMELNNSVRLREERKSSEPILTAPSSAHSLLTPTIIVAQIVYFRVKFCAILFLGGLAAGELQGPG